jgi:inosine/xanthosine triphosphatase
MKVCLGGTFDVIHEGHKKLLDLAFSLGVPVLIGLTSDRYAKKGRKEVNTHKVRKKNLEAYLKRKKFKSFELVSINDSYGPSVSMKDLDVIVVSEGTVRRARRINKVREAKGMKALKVIVVPFVLADDSVPISSRRIRNGDIDARGRMKRPVVIRVGSKNRNKVAAAKKVFSRFFKELKVRTVKVETSVPEQPFDNDTVKGARERAAKALEKGGDFGVGIEAGLFWNPVARKYFDVQYCAVMDKMGNMTIGHGSGFCYPDEVVAEIERGATVSEAMEVATGIKDIGEKMGAVGYLTKGKLNRAELTEQAVLMALIPRIRRELYP